MSFCEANNRLEPSIPSISGELIRRKGHLDGWDSIGFWGWWILLMQ
jgi:hypothetical protein